MAISNQETLYCAIFSSKVKLSAVGNRMAISNREHCAIFISKV